MVLICTTLGATNRYADQDMLRRTLTGFLLSLQRQTDDRFVAFISCHDIPEWAPEDPRFIWCSVDPDGKSEYTLVPAYQMRLSHNEVREQMVMVPSNAANILEFNPSTLRLRDGIIYKQLPYGGLSGDMSRKTTHSAIEAGHWASRNWVEEFWMLRMDSDDLLAQDHVEFLEGLAGSQIDAVFNKKCHIYDLQSGEIGVYAYGHSTTCNALRMRIKGDVLPNWFYHCIDHTTFARTLARDGIAGMEKDWAMCITSNSGNSISNRGRLEENREADVSRIPLTERLVTRYGLDHLEGARL